MSIHLPVQQGTHEWRMCRLGLPTASVFKRLITPKKLDVSKAGIASLASELIAERALMKPLEVDLAGFAERGTMLENEAVPWYEMQRDVTVSRVGFCLDPDALVGCSPDGVTPDGGLEVKSLSPAKHLRILIDGDISDYMAQVQGCMWLCERREWDTLFYHPQLPSRILTVGKDAGYICKLADAVDALNKALASLERKLEAADVDFSPWREHIAARQRGEVPQRPDDLPPPLSEGLGLLAGIGRGVN